MALPKRIPKPPKRESRWRSQAHCNFVRSHACSMCGSTEAIEVAHVRNGSGAGMGQKPDDWLTVSLCKNCHNRQHQDGEDTFWREYLLSHGQNIHRLISEFINASPKRAEILKVMKDRADG